MRNQTELMRSILTNQTAQRIIDFVSPVYGDSYVGLWIFQAIGVALDDICTISDQLRYETNASTSDLLLDCWEKQYGIPADSSLTKEQRRVRIINRKKSKGPANPKRIEDAASEALVGAVVKITENVAQNTFLVNIHDVVPSYEPAIKVIEQRKPAHLIYRVRSCAVSDAKITVAVAVSHYEQYEIRVGSNNASVGVTVAVAVSHSEQYKLEVQK